MSTILSGLDRVVYLVDNILVFGSSQQEHDEWLKAVLRRIKEAGLTLNKQKCQFSKSSMRFLGQVVDATGVKPDPDKIRAIIKMKSSQVFQNCADFWVWSTR